MLYRDGERLYGLGDRCTHAGGPLHRGLIGRMSGEPTVTCPLHGSLFRLVDGRVFRGPAARPEPVFEVRERDGSIEVRDPA
jgi:nitrite reductase/ring-hydroxylating ferredoxin subunit